MLSLQIGTTSSLKLFGFFLWQQTVVTFESQIVCYPTLQQDLATSMHPKSLRKDYCDSMNQRYVQLIDRS